MSTVATAVPTLHARLQYVPRLTRTYSFCCKPWSSIIGELVHRNGLPAFARGDPGGAHWLDHQGRLIAHEAA